MAPESLTEVVFSIQSVPYPEFEFRQLIRELLIGYRMDKPQLATNEISRLRADWQKLDPNERPTFNKLQEALGSNLESSFRDQYLDMNEPYMQLNKENQKNINCRFRLLLQIRRKSLIPCSRRVHFLQASVGSSTSSH